MGRKGLQLIMDAKLQNSCHLAASTASGQEPVGLLSLPCPPPLAPPPRQWLLLPSHLVQLLEVSGESLTHPGFCKDAREGGV